jgi:hypothetical protein
MQASVHKGQLGNLLTTEYGYLAILHIPLVVGPLPRANLRNAAQSTTRVKDTSNCPSGWEGYRQSTSQKGAGACNHFAVDRQLDQLPLLIQPPCHLMHSAGRGLTQVPKIAALPPVRAPRISD